jgi:hypothetical protein
MAEKSEYLYDVFISHSKADQEWVDEWLLPRLEQAGLRVAVDYRDFIIGMPRIKNIERAVEHSRRTIVVLTPAWLDSEWNAFEALLLRTMDPAARQRKLLPVLLKPCEPSDLIASLEKVDLTVERHWEKQLQRLTRDIRDVIPVSPPWKEGGVRDFTQWKRWIKRYRRELRRGVVALCALWLAGSITLQLPPFEPRQVWMSQGLRAPNATKLVRVGDVLLVGGANVELGCELLERGLWRSANNGATWQPIHAPLCFERPGQGPVLADIVDFALTETQPERIYAASSDVGLLRSDDAGQTWRRTGDAGLESSQLVQVAVDPDNADRVFVAAQAGGLYRSTDGGQHWQRLDRRQPDAPSCEQGMILTQTLSVGALLATPEKVLVGTSDPFELTDAHVPSGLYASADAGDCWEQVDDGEGRYQYAALTHLPAAPGQPLLVLARDWWKEPGSGTWGLWRLDMASSPSRRELLWTHDHTVGAVMAEDGVNPGWYVATNLGEMVRGSLDVPAQVKKLPRLTRCMLPPTCDVAWVADTGEGPPVLLAGGRVFRLTPGPWWRRVWP